MNQEIEPVDVTEAMQHLIELLRGIDLAFDRKPKEPLTPKQNSSDMPRPFRLLAGSS